MLGVIEFKCSMIACVLDHPKKNSLLYNNLSMPNNFHNMIVGCWLSSKIIQATSVP